MAATKKTLTAFGKEIKYRLIDLGKTQKWLVEQVSAKTGLFVDDSYIGKISTGERNAPKIVQAICEILDIDQSTMKGE